MRIKVQEVGRALHPSEVVIAVETKDGVEQLAVSNTSLQDSAIDVGWPVGQRDGFFLVELPRETFRGFWRVWVQKSKLISTDEETRAIA